MMIVIGKTEYAMGASSVSGTGLSYTQQELDGAGIKDTPASCPFQQLLRGQGGSKCKAGEIDA